MITAKTFKDLRIQSVIDKNYDTVLSITALYLYMSEATDPQFQLILTKEDTALSSLQTLLCYFIKPKVIELVKVNYDYINTSLRTMNGPNKRALIIPKEIIFVYRGFIMK